MGILWKEKLGRKRNTSVQHRIPLMQPEYFLLFSQGKEESMALAGVPEKYPIFAEMQKACVAAVSPP